MCVAVILIEVGLMTPAAAGDQGHGLGGGASPCPVDVEAFRFFPVGQ